MARTFNRYTADDIRKLRTDRLALNDAILRLEPLIKKAAYKIGFYRENHYHEGMELEDAMQAGRIGAWQAIMKFDPNLGASLEAYVYTKARNHILDEMRLCQWSRGSRQHRMIIEHNDQWEIEQNIRRDEALPEDPTFDIAANEEWCDKIDAAASQMDWKRRNVYWGVMKKDDAWSQARQGEGVTEALDICESRVSQYRKDIRKKLQLVIH